MVQILVLVFYFSGSTGAANDINSGPSGTEPRSEVESPDEEDVQGHTTSGKDGTERSPGGAARVQPIQHVRPMPIIIAPTTAPLRYPPRIPLAAGDADDGDEDAGQRRRERGRSRSPYSRRPRDVSPPPVRPKRTDFIRPGYQGCGTGYQFAVWRYYAAKMAYEARHGISLPRSPTRSPPRIRRVTPGPVSSGDRTSPVSPRAIMDNLRDLRERLLNQETSRVQELTNLLQNTPNTTTEVGRLIRLEQKRLDDLRRLLGSSTQRPVRIIRMNRNLSEGLGQAAGVAQSGQQEPSSEPCDLTMSDTEDDVIYWWDHLSRFRDSH